MDEIQNTLEYQSDLIQWELKDCEDKDKKEILNLAKMAIDEAVSYLDDLIDLNNL